MHDVINKWIKNWTIEIKVIDGLYRLNIYLKLIESENVIYNNRAINKNKNVNKLIINNVIYIYEYARSRKSLKNKEILKNIAFLLREHLLYSHNNKIN